MTIVISDLHLINIFDKNKFQILQKIIEPAEQIIINGDLWIDQRTTFDIFISSEWSRLFPLLKARNTIYIVGNQDRRESMNKQVSLFCNKMVDTYTMKKGEYKYYFEHGHQRFWKLPLAIIEGLFIHNDYLDQYDYKKTLKYGYPKNIFGRIFNLRYKLYAKESMGENEFLVIGHTHQPEIDLENHFINCGIIDYGCVHYLQITENGPIMKKDHYIDMRSQRNYVS